MFAFLRMSLAVRSQEVAFVGKCSLCLWEERGERGRKSWCCWPEWRGQGTEGERDAGCCTESWEGLAFGGKCPGHPPRDESRAKHQAAQSHLKTLPTRSLVAVGQPSSGVLLRPGQCPMERNPQLFAFHWCWSDSLKGKPARWRPYGPH